MIQLDANFLVSALASGTPAEAQLRRWLTSGETVAISAVAWEEFLCGPLTAEDEVAARRLLPQAEPLLAEDATQAAALFNLTGRRSRSLADCMIAAVAMRTGARLATINVADFQPFQPHGLNLA